MFPEKQARLSLKKTLAFVFQQMSYFISRELGIRNLPTISWFVLVGFAFDYRPRLCGSHSFRDAGILPIVFFVHKPGTCYCSLLIKCQATSALCSGVDLLSKYTMALAASLNILGKLSFFFYLLIRSRLCKLSFSSVTRSDRSRPSFAWQLETTLVSV